MLKQYLEAGKIVTTHGLKGETKIYPWTDVPDDMLELKELYLDKGASHLEIERIRTQGNMVLAKFKGIDTIEQAQRLRGRVLYVNRNDIPLE